MINLETITISKCVVHWVGNSYTGEKSIFSENEIFFDEFQQTEVKQIFTKYFKNNPKSLKFFHSIDLNQNTIYKIAEDIFDSPRNHLKNTKNIIKYLYEQTIHHSIKPGEVFILNFEEVRFDEVVTNAIGIFKIETPTDFIKSDYNGKSINILFDKGIVAKNIEKGCIIINTDFHAGYVVYNYEKNNADTNYWTKNFLSIKIREDNFNSTNSLLESYREFVIHDLQGENLTKKDKIDLVNKSIDFVAENPSSINIKNFINSNLPGKAEQKLYSNYLATYCENNEIEITDSFMPSLEATKLQKKRFKSIIKLDSNFHIYIHGNENLIENGVEKNGKKFYKIYYENEI